jgi:hypothetical protein
MVFKKVDSLKRINGRVFSIEASDTEFVLEVESKDVLSQYVWNFGHADLGLKKNLTEFQAEIAMLETATALARSWVQHQLEKMEKVPVPTAKKTKRKVL